MVLDKFKNEQKQKGSETLQEWSIHKRIKGKRKTEVLTVESLWLPTPKKSKNSLVELHTTWSEGRKVGQIQIATTTKFELKNPNLYKGMLSFSGLNSSKRNNKSI